MQPQTAKSLISRWFEEVWNKGRREAITEMLPATAILHDGGNSSRGPADFLLFFDRMHAAFSEIKVKIEDEISQGDRACARWTCTMKHTGHGMGLPPTGKSVEVTGMTILSIENGAIVEGWQNWDMLHLLQQIQGTVHTPPTYIAP